MRQFPPPPSFGRGMADTLDEFLRGCRLIRWELQLPPLHAHTEVALNWLLAGGRQTTNLFQRRVCAQRPWCLHITSEARQLTVGCGWEPWWWTGHRCMPASTPLPSSHAERGECWEFSLLLPTAPALLGFKCSKWFSKFVQMNHWCKIWLQMLILMLSVMTELSPVGGRGIKKGPSLGAVIY